MHPKNPFAKDYDFDKLVQQHAPLNDFVFINEHGNKTIKFGEHQAVKTLNSALLKAQYGIVWNIPDQYLCPPIPGRLDYLLHVADLIRKTDVRLLDVGTGANLIYPILATCHLKWMCIACETDKDALKNAQSIIDQNKQLQKTELRHQKIRHKILEHIIEPDDCFDVVVCNPPFFKSLYDAQQENKRKAGNLKLRQKDSQNFGGRSNEVWFRGGEVAFLKNMATESVLFKNQVHWFTSLVSKKQHLGSIKRAILKTNPTDLRVIDMALGNKKSRFVAWSFR